MKRKEFSFNMKIVKNEKSAALLISTVLVIVTATCLLYLFLIPRTYGDCVAEIYQDGRLLQSIPLGQVQTSYTIEINGVDGCTNRIEVLPGGIGVVWADCPDQLCVRQGLIETPVIPIVCLPNKLVIRLRTEKETGADPDTPDTITY